MTQTNEGADQPIANIEAEAGLLGAILINNDAMHVVSGWLEPAHFHDALHARIYEACRAEIRANRAPTPITLRNALEDEQVGDTSVMQYLARLVSQAITVANMRDYGMAVLDCHRASLLRSSIQDAGRALGRPVNLEECLRDIEAACGEVRGLAPQARSDGDMKSAFAELAEATADAYERDTPAGFTWCLPEIDTLMGGPAQKGELYGLLGASQEGKTSLVLQQMLHSAQKGDPALFLSGEQSRLACSRQMIAQRIGLSARDTRSGNVDRDSFERMVEESKQIEALPINVEPWSRANVPELKGRIKRFVRRHGPGIVAIDHAKKITWRDPKGMFADQIAALYNDLHDVAAETECAIIILMQRNTPDGQRRSKRPIRRDAYGGDGALQGLDGCLALYREEMWLREDLKTENRKEQRAMIGARLADVAGLSEFHTLKSRFGGADRACEVVEFNGPRTLFISRAADRQDDLL